MINLPSKKEILIFTQEQVELLPSVTDCQSIPAGSFAKIGHLKTKSSLVFITLNDTINKNVGTICYVECNTFNGVISSNEWAGTYIKDTYIYGGEFWKRISNNLQLINND